MKARLEYGGEQHETDWIEIEVGKHTYLVTPGTQKPNGLRVVAESGTSPATHVIPLMGNVIEVVNPSISMDEWQQMYGTQQAPADDATE